MVKSHLIQIVKDYHTKEDYSKYELLFLQYNLGGKVQKQYQDVCKEGANAIYWYNTHNYTCDLDPPVTCAKKRIKFWFGVYLHGCIWDFGNVDIWGS